MKILLIGGTVFAGRAIVDYALSRGHEITLFNRGQNNPELYPDVEKLRGNRDGGLDVLKGRTWDAVIDTCGYAPRVVSASARLLADATDHYTFISSLSVYDGALMEPDEHSAVATMPDESVEEINGETYGALKALCEKAAEAAMPGRVLNVRPGLIVGPHDRSDRFTYWPVRVARGGEVLAPGRPTDTVQFIDVRDLGEWIVRMVEAHKVGVYNANSPKGAFTMGEVLHTCRAEAGSDATFTWIPDKWLEEKKVGPWMELPLWLPPGTGDGMYTTKVGKAVSDGLTFRPLSETVRDTLAWHGTLPADRPWKAGLKAEKETELLAAWHAEQ